MSVTDGRMWRAHPAGVPTLPDAWFTGAKCVRTSADTAD